MELKVLNTIPCERQKEYEELLLSNFSTLFYQSLNFHDLLKEHLACLSIYFVWENDKKYVATISFLYKTSEIYGTVVNSLPYYGSNGSFVFESTLRPQEKESIRNEFKTAFLNFINENKVVLSTIITNPFENEDNEWIKKNISHDFFDSRIGQITPLPSFSENIENDLMNIFADPRPRNIRRAKKAGISIKTEHNKEALQFLYDTHKKNIESVGGKAKKESFFQLIPNFFNETQFSLYLAYKENKPIAALLLFYFNKTVEYYTPATEHDFRNDQPSSLLIYQAMIDASKRGFKYWNWGGTWKTQHGVYDFKKKWGAQDKEYFYYTTIHNKEIMNYHIQELSRAFPNFFLYPY